MIGVGIIGAGHFGAVHARAMREVREVELVAACREDRSGAEAFVAEHGGTAFTDWRRLIEEPRVEAVLIATPHHLHEEIAVAAALAGKHILLEKPMAPTRAGCDAILSAAARSGVQLMVGHVMHFARPCLLARDIILGNELGRPRVGSSWMIKLWMESNRRQWHLERKTGGGMLMTAGIHALDRLMWLMGEPVVGVTAMLGASFHAQEADDTALLGLRFANGGIGQVQSVGYRNGAVSFAMELVCERGTIEIDFERGVTIGQDGRRVLVPNSTEPDWMHHAVAREWRAMADAITGGAPPPVSADYARSVVAVIESAYHADRLRREIDPGRMGDPT